jgi:hemerythrin superfamily protein
MAELDTTPREGDDVVTVLLLQHVRIKELLAEVRGSSGEARQRAFDELRELLAKHETAEELVVRPVTRKAAADVADARNHEEDEAAHALAELEKLDVDSPEFARKFTAFEDDVMRHAELEETEEFPRLREAHDEEELQKLARMLLTAEKLGPTHPHPSTAGSPAAQAMAGPFAAMLDRARDAMKAALPG